MGEPSDWMSAGIEAGVSPPFATFDSYDNYIKLSY